MLPYFARSVYFPSALNFLCLPRLYLHSKSNEGSTRFVLAQLQKKLMQCSLTETEIKRHARNGKISSAEKCKRTAKKMASLNSATYKAVNCLKMRHFWHTIYWLAVFVIETCFGNCINFLPNQPFSCLIFFYIDRFHWRHDIFSSLL